MPRNAFSCYIRVLLPAINPTVLILAYKEHMYCQYLIIVRRYGSPHHITDIKIDWICAKTIY